MNVIERLTFTICLNDEVISDRWTDKRMFRFNESYSLNGKMFIHVSDTCVSASTSLCIKEQTFFNNGSQTRLTKGNYWIVSFNNIRWIEQELQDGSISLSPLYSSLTIDLHVKSFDSKLLKAKVSFGFTLFKNVDSTFLYSLSSLRFQIYSTRWYPTDKRRSFQDWCGGCISEVYHESNPKQGLLNSV